MGKELHKKALEEVKCDKVFAVSKTTQEDKQKREGSISAEDDDSSVDAGDLTSVDDDSDTGFFDEADSEDYISDDDDDGLIINKDDDDGLIINKIDGLTDFDEFRRNIPTVDVYNSDSTDSNSSAYHSDSSEFEEGLDADEVVRFKFGEMSSQQLKSCGFRDCTFKAYTALGHYTIPEEMDDLCAWLTSKLGLEG